MKKLKNLLCRACKKLKKMLKYEPFTYEWDKTKYCRYIHKFTSEEV